MAISNKPNGVAEARCRDRRNLCAVTLVEMLVVVALIAVLASILLVVITRVRAVSVQVECQEHLRQLGAALNSIAADNNACYPLFRDENGVRWWEKVADQIDARPDQVEVRPAGPQLPPLPKAMQIFHCRAAAGLQNMDVMAYGHRTDVDGASLTDSGVTWVADSFKDKWLRVTDQSEWRHNRIRIKGNDATRLDFYETLTSQPPATSGQAQNDYVILDPEPLERSISYGMNFDVADANGKAYTLGEASEQATRQIWVRGTASDGNATQLIDEIDPNFKTPWTPDQFKDKYVQLLSGAGAFDDRAGLFAAGTFPPPIPAGFQIRRITGNSDNTLFVTPPFAPAPTDGTAYQIIETRSFNDKKADYNIAQPDGAAIMGIPLTRIRRPSEFILLSEANTESRAQSRWTGGRISMTGVERFWPPVAAASNPVPDDPPGNAPIIGRHNGMANVLFADQHVEAMPAEYSVDNSGNVRVLSDNWANVNLRPGLWTLPDDKPEDR